MKQLLVGGLMVVLSSLAWAQEEQPEVKYNVELRARYYNITKGAGGDEPGSGYDGSEAYFEQRSLLGLGFRRGERVGGQFTLIHNAHWGRTQTWDGETANNRFAPNTGDTAAGTPNGVGNSENMLLLNEAWGWWKMTDSVTLRLGRSGLTIADGSVISRNDWEPTPTSFEGAMLFWDTDSLVMNAFAVKLEELPRRTRGGSDANDPESNLYGVSFDRKMLPEFIQILNGHLIQINSSQATLPNLPTTGGIPTSATIDLLGKNIQRLGFTVQGEWKNLGLNLSGAFEQGKMTQKPQDEIIVQSHMLDFEIGYRFPVFINLHLLANIHLDSGDGDVSERKGTHSSVGEDNKWTRYNSFFYDSHKYAGLMDLIGWGNLTYYHLGLTSEPFENANLGVHYLLFDRTSERDGVVAGTLGQEMFDGFVPHATHREDKRIGQELDLSLDYNFDGGFTTGLRLGLFFPGSYLKDGTNSTTGTTGEQSLGETVRQVVAQAQYTF